MGGRSVHVNGVDVRHAMFRVAWRRLRPRGPLVALSLRLSRCDLRQSWDRTWGPQRRLWGDAGSHKMVTMRDRRWTYPAMAGPGPCRCQLQSLRSRVVWGAARTPVLSGPPRGARAGSWCPERLAQSRHPAALSPGLEPLCARSLPHSVW